MKIKAVFNLDNSEIVGWEFKCPGCKHLHVFWTKPFDTQQIWDYNHNPKSPTFSPSLLNTCDNPQSKEVIKRCHLFVNNGQIQFLNDCTHELAGQTVEMETISVNFYQQ